VAYGTGGFSAAVKLFRDLAEREADLAFDSFTSSGEISARMRLAAIALVSFQVYLLFLPLLIPNS
jgi:hypothetical protein